MTKSYNQTCPLACALDIIGEKWTPLILRELLLESPKRYQDLLNSLPSLSASTLSERLKKLEKHKIVERQFYSDHPPRAQYILTQKGHDLRPALIALRDWGEKHADLK
ncbi:MAG: helix-turn-helix transcriptional regulator [Rhizobiales bacterium]|nr:helix-turn-helix transcriptional regulator [Hyphomicrobiales bacterium]